MFPELTPWVAWHWVVSYSLASWYSWEEGRE